MANFPDLQIQVAANNQLTFPWAEYISRQGSTFDSKFGHGGATHAMTIIVYWEHLETAVQELLGWSEVEEFDDPLQNRLIRYIPFRHPKWTQLWCTEISKAEGVRFVGKENFEEFGPVGTTQYVLLTLQFSRPNYAILRDDEVEIQVDGHRRKEWTRYLDRHWKPQVQILTREGGQFKYTEGLATDRRVVGPIGQKMVRYKLERTWYQIPEKAIFNSDGFPRKFITQTLAIGGEKSIMATVNDEEFLGCEPETLLFMAPDLIQRPLPMPAELMGLIDSETYPNQYDIKFNFEYFRPPRGFVDRAIPSFVSSVGHNCLPWPVDARWYRVESEEGAQPMFQQSDFEDLFDPI